MAKTDKPVQRGARVQPADSLLNLINASGFAFQLAIEETVRVTGLEERHDWSSISREHGWNDGGTPRFIDLVLQLAGGPVYLVVECKRPRGGEWVFLVPDAPKGRRAELRRHFRAQYLRKALPNEHEASCRTILVEKTDRLYRNIRDWITVDELDLTVHFVKENAVVSKTSRSSEKFLHGIKVLMAKNYIDNLSEEVKKGLREKAEQDHWPTKAPVGYVDNRTTHRIEVDPVRGPLIAQLFELYATGTYSLKALTAKAHAIGLTHPRSGRRMMKAEIHRILRNVIYTGDFRWHGKRYRGSHPPLVSRELFQQVQDVLDRKPRARYPRQKHAFMGLLTCGRCGCSISAERKKGKYTYYRCTGFRGACGNSYIREEQLADLLGRVVERIQIPVDIADWIAQGLRDSEYSLEQTRQESLARLRQRRQSVQSKLDRAYDDYLDGRLSKSLWTRKSAQWESELATIAAELTRLSRPTTEYVRSPWPKATAARLRTVSSPRTER